MVKVMHGRLKKHLCINNTLAHNNLAKEALTENPWKWTHSVFKSQAEKKHAGGIFHTLTKTFENANHEPLLVKLLYMALRTICKIECTVYTTVLIKLN